MGYDIPLSAQGRMLPARGARCYEGYYRHCPAINNEKRQQILKKSVAFFIAVKAATKTTSTLLQKTSLFYRRKPPIIWASASASVNPKDISFIN